MTNKSIFYGIGILMWLLAAGYVAFAFTHPECSFPWPNWVSRCLYALYCIYALSMFLLPRWKNSDLGTCFILALDFIAIGLILISIGVRAQANESNWYLPAGLFLTCIANFYNFFRSRKREKAAAEKADSQEK